MGGVKGSAVKTSRAACLLCNYAILAHLLQATATPSGVRCAHVPLFVRVPVLLGQRAQHARCSVKRADAARRSPTEASPSHYAILPFLPIRAARCTC